MSRNKIKLILPVIVILIGALGAVGMIAARPDVETRAAEVRAPLIRVITAQVSDLQFRVSAQGSVTPRTESSVVPEVSGRVEWVSPALAPGGFFEKGDALLRIERRDGEITLRQARAARARASSEVRLAHANLRRSRDLAGRGVVSSAELDRVQNSASVAEAALLEADARLERATSDLERTEIRAPFAGRVREKMVDVGQFVNRGAPVATIYAVDYAEVRLPIPDDQLAFVDLPRHYRGESEKDDTPRVILRASIGGSEYEWQGTIVRTEGEIDPRSRMVHAVAQVADPYARSAGMARPPLAVGLFVEAEIFGRTVKDVIVLPRAAVRGQDRVLVVENDRLHYRDVEVIRAERENVIIGGGLKPGELVAISPIEAAVDGMRVRVAEQTAARERPAAPKL